MVALRFKRLFSVPVPISLIQSYPVAFRLNFSGLRVNEALSAESRKLGVFSA